MVVKVLTTISIEVIGMSDYIDTREFSEGKTRGLISKIGVGNRVQAKAEYADAFHGPGLYIYITNGSEKSPPRAYAGKCTHLDSRANDVSRLNTRSWIYLIKFRDGKGRIGHMDENWRQHLESLLIDHIRQDPFGTNVQPDNKRGEGKSFMEDTGEPEAWFKLLIAELAALDCPSFSRTVYTAPTPAPTCLISLLPSRKIEKTYAVDKARLNLRSGEVTIPAGSRATNGCWSIDVAYQDEKARLINEEVLELKSETVDGEKKDYFEFTKDHQFSGLTEATAIIYDSQPGAKIWRLCDGRNTRLNETNEWRTYTKVAS